MSKSNDTPLNLLASYAYLGGQKNFCHTFFGAHRSGVANCMVDSGAFTKLNAKTRRDWLTLDNYCSFIEEHEKDCEKYVALDVIGKEQETKRNYEIMVRRGLSPMFVLTMFDKDWSYLNETMKINSHCCVAGGTMTKGPWLIKRFQDSVQHTAGQIKIHALGYVCFPNIVRAPIVSGDSSSWDVGARKFGKINVFCRKGLIGASYKEYWNGKPLQNEIKMALERIQVTPSEFVRPENNCGANSLELLLSILAYLDYQKWAYARGRRLFLAASSESVLNKILWVYHNREDATFRNFRKEFGK